MGANTKDDFEYLYKRYRYTESGELMALGRKYLQQSRDSAMAIFTLVAHRYDGDGDSINREYAIKARLSLGVINFLNANYPSAYSNFLTASQLENRKDSRGNLNLASIYLYYGDKQRAYRCLRDVFDAAVRSRNYPMASNALINILLDDIDAQILPSDSLRRLIGIFRSGVPYSPDNTAWTLSDQLASATEYTLDGDLRNSIEILKAAISSTKNVLLPPRNRFSIYVELGRKYLALNRPDSASYYLMTAHDIARDNGFTELLISIYTDLSRFYAATGNSRLASEYKYKHLELHDSVFNAKEFGRIHDLELFHETDILEKRITRMNIERKMRMRILLTVTIALIVVSVCLFILYRNNRSLRLKNKVLFEKNLESIAAADTMLAHKPEEPKKYTTSPLTNATRKALVERINIVMNDESIYCTEGFSLATLAEKCESNQKYVSQVLNEDFGKGFTQLLNEKRVSLASIRLLERKKYGHLTIEAIVADLGFKSRTTFSKTFKRITGLTPTEFQRMASKEPDADD